MPLTDTEAKKAKPLEKDYQKKDSKGLSLVIRKKGQKHGAMNSGPPVKRIMVYFYAVISVTL